MSRHVSSDLLPIPIHGRIRRAKKIEVVEPDFSRNAADRPVVDSLAATQRGKLELASDRRRAAEGIDDGFVRVFSVHGDD